MSLSSSAILEWHHCNFPWYFDRRHFPPKVYGRGRFDLPHKQQDYILRPCESIGWISPCLINLAQRPIEDITCMLFGYLALKEEPLLTLETCWRDRTYCSHRGIEEALPTRKTGISASDFLLFFLVGVLFLKSVQIFLKEIFWRSKQTFEFSGPCSEIRRAKWTNHSARSTREM